MNNPQNADSWKTAYNALDLCIAVFDTKGNSVFINEYLTAVLPQTPLHYKSIFDLIDDHRIEESLRKHIFSTNKEEYAFTANIAKQTYYFHVTRHQNYFICCGQSEKDIEVHYHLQVASQRKMLEMKTRLLEVSQMDKTDFDKALLFILKSAAEILDCERVSYWKVNAAQDELICEKLFLNSKQNFEKHDTKIVLYKKDIPRYFDYINKENAFIMANDIYNHAATKEFNDNYSKPNQIFSLLDVPVWHNNRIYGIICCEQVGEPKEWQLEDARFMLSLSDNLSVCLQTKDKMKAENMLKESNEKLKQSNTNLEHFATIAAHDMKSPLRNVVNFLSLLKQKHGNELNSEAQEYVDYTLQNAKQLHQLISDLLAYSRIDKKLSTPVAVNIKDLIDQIIEEQKDFITEKNGTILTQGKMPIIMAQKNLVYQLFSNLIHNAIKFSNNEVPPVLEIKCLQKENELSFLFSDNGIGIDDDYAENIFSLFGRTKAVEEFDGTGIGLATCKRIAEIFNGRISYMRRVQPTGSVFNIHLPATMLIPVTTSMV